MTGLGLGINYPLASSSGCKRGPVQHSPLILPRDRVEPQSSICRRDDCLFPSIQQRRAPQSPVMSASSDQPRPVYLHRGRNSPRWGMRHLGCARGKDGGLTIGTFETQHYELLWRGISYAYSPGGLDGEPWAGFGLGVAVASGYWFGSRMTVRCRLDA